MCRVLPAALSCLLPAPSLLLWLEVQVPPEQQQVAVHHLTVAGDCWTAEVAGRRMAGQVLLHSHAGEQVLTLWLNGRSYEFRWASEHCAALSHGHTIMQVHVHTACSSHSLH